MLKVSRILTAMYDQYDEDSHMIRSEFADPGGTSALRAGKRIYPCPTCGHPNRLTEKDKQLGYQCDSCADAAEGIGDIDYYVPEEKKKPVKMVKKKCYACGDQGTVPGSWKPCPTCSGSGTLMSEAVATKCPGCGEMVTTKSGWCPDCNKQRRDYRFGAADD